MSSFNPKLIKNTFLILILIEILSFLAWKIPVLNLICFGLILLITLILSLRKLEYGLYITFAELFIGSYGRIFSLNGFSIRMGLFAVIMAVWLFNVFKHKKINFKIQKEFIWLAAVLVWGFAWGLIQGTGLTNVFLDFNNWLYFLLILPILSIKNKDRFIKNILNILIASTILIGLKTLILFYLFSHNYAEIMGILYRWVRDTRVGEITLMNGNFYRIFIQSQIYSVLAFLIILVKSSPPAGRAGKLKVESLKNKKTLIAHYSLLITCLTTIILSFSRSYWVGLTTGLIIYFIFILRITDYACLPARQELRITLLNFFKKFAKVLMITIISLAVVGLVFILPPKTEGQDLLALFKSRATQAEAASSSRLAQLKPLSLAIVKHPIIGSGFGTQVTYFSDDPRIKGEITTYAFEWGYLDMILKFGLFGLVIYLILIFKIGKKLFKKKEIGLLLSLISLLIINIFSPYLNHPLGIGLILISLSFVYGKE